MIYEGRMAYYGPANRARQYFIDLGYEPANRQTTPDFLVSVTDPNARIPRQVLHPLPRSAKEFADYFQASDLGWKNQEEISGMRDDLRDRKDGIEPYQTSAETEHWKGARLQSPYIQSIFAQSWEVVIRRALIFKGSLFVTITNLLCVFLSFIYSSTKLINHSAFAFQGVIIGTVYLKSAETTAAFFSRSGVLFLFVQLFSFLLQFSSSS